MSLHEWFIANLLWRFHDGLPTDWDVRFVLTIFWIWKWRNAFVFLEEMVPVMAKITLLKQLWLEVFEAYKLKRLINLRSCRMRAWLLRRLF